MSAQGRAVATPRVARRLAAILAADVVGYSRLTGRDEAGTIARLRAVRKKLVEPIIARHGGRIVKLMGDGALVEFPSVVDAVEAAVVVQRGMAGYDHGREGADRIRFRIGVNLGDIVVDGDDILGDGVNIASRLEGLAEPGGICVSGTVHEQIRDKLPYTFEDTGEQAVKNIARPVRVYALGSEALASLPEVVATVRPRAARRTTAVRGILAAAAGVIVVLASSWWFRPSPRAPPPASRETARAIAPAASDPRLSIVVLPFRNFGNDPEEEYFAEGITDDLTTDLARVEDSFVISRGTASTYKGEAVDARQLGRELGVRYVLDGRLQREGGRLRVSVALIDAATGGDVWADRFEGDWTRSMEVQDQITARLARTLDLALTDAESRRAEAERPNDPGALDLTMRGWSALNRPLSKESLAQARALFERALRLDPDLPKALVGLARTLAAAAASHMSDAAAEDLTRADDAVTRVLAKFPDHAMAHYVKGEILMTRKDFARAVDEYGAAISSNRDLAPAYAAIGRALVRAGRAEEAFAPLERAIRLSPRDPLLSIWYFSLCHAHSHLGQDQAAIEWCGRAVAVSPYWVAYVDLASAYAWTGQDAEARAAVARLRELMPGYTVARWAHEDWSANPVFLVQYERITEGLRKAGLVEE